jgi:hypothetical protein
MAPNSKNYDGYQFIRTKSTWKPNFPQIGGFLYFGGHMVQHVLLPKFKMATVVMVTNVQKMLYSLRTADPFET